MGGSQSERVDSLRGVQCIYCEGAYSFADTGTAEKSNLSSFRIWREQINDLDSSHQDLLGFALEDCTKCALSRRGSYE